MPGSQFAGDTWYAARLTFKSRLGPAVETDPLCEDRVVLFFASDERSAWEAAVKYGRGNQPAYRYERSELVEWRFVRVEQLEEVGSEPEETGWEVAARHFRPSDLAREKAAENRASAE